MASEMLCIFVIISLSVTTGAWQTDRMGQCSQEDSNKMDLAFGEIFLFGQLKNEMIKDLETTKEWCRKSSNGVKVIKETSNKCLTGLPKQVLNLIMYGLRKGIKKNCKDDAAKQLAGNDLGCLNKVLPRMTETMEHLTRRLRSVNSLPSEDKINGICCSFYKFQSRIAKIGSSECPANTVDHMDDLINDFSGEALDLVCRSIPRDSQVCSTLSLPISKSINSSLESVTFVPACIDALSRL